jgi:hypothetical protein
MEVEERAEAGFIEERRSRGGQRSKACELSCTTHVGSEYTAQQLHGHLLLTKKYCGVVQLATKGARECKGHGAQDTGENTSQGD